MSRDRSSTAAAPHPEVLAFLQAIKEYPDDDSPRLIFADWLEEQGDPRGEFIRIQCQLARITWRDPHQKELKHREWELLKQHRYEWLGPLATIWSLACQFQRGLVHITASRAGALVQNQQLVEEQTGAWLEGLTLKEIRSDWIAGFRHGGAWGEVASPLGELDRVVQCPLLAHLSSLDLSDNRICSKGAAALAASPHLAHLSSLDLSDNRIGDEGVAALAASPHLAHLTSLVLRNNNIGRKGAKALWQRFGDRVKL